jgi:hypothetical protein
MSNKPHGTGSEYFLISDTTLELAGGTYDLHKRPQTRERL